MLRLFLLYAISGFISLGYQVAWFRIFTDWFGSTNLTFALVVCCFIGGLGLGALWSKPVANWISRSLHLDNRIRLYGMIELLVSAAAVLTLLMAYLPSDLWGSFPYHIIDGIWIKNFDYQIGQVLVGIVCVTLPCFFMGVTFPLLCDAFVEQKGSSRLPSALYAWNTLGACSGVLACQFLFLPRLGHGNVYLMMVMMNALLGGYFVATGGGRKLSGLSSKSKLVEEGASSSAEQGSFSDPARGSRSMLFTAAVLSGLLAGALEGDMFKRISFIITGSPGAAMTAISFWAILGIFLASTLVRVAPAMRLIHIKLSYLLSLGCYAALWFFSYPVLNYFETIQAQLQNTIILEPIPTISMFPGSMLRLFVLIGVYVLPVYFLISMLLPWACNRLQADKKHLGLAYGMNTIAFCIGMIGFTLVAPTVSIFYSLKLIFVLFSCACLLLLLVVTENRPVAMWKPSVAAAIFIVGCFFTPSGFDRSYMNPGLPPANNPVSSVKSNGAVTTLVVSKPGGYKALYFGNMSMSGANLFSAVYMRVMAHVPLLAQDEPKKALLICFGVGNTASAIAMHDSISNIDIVDLNGNVFESAWEFSATNNNVHLDPRVRLIKDDGRSYLSISDEKYDLITSEPPPPMSAGVYRLYSKEYYEDVLSHLTSQGMMSQWLPYYQMTPEAVAMAIETFTHVFPYTVMISGMAEDLILIGAKEPIDFERIGDRFWDDQAVVADLEKHIVSEPLDIYVRVLQTDAQLRRNYADSGLISDKHNHIENMFRAWGRIPRIEYDPAAILREMSVQSPTVAAQMDPIVTHLGRLNFRIPAFPLYEVKKDAAVKYSDADWSRITYEYRQGISLAVKNDPAMAAAAFLRAIELAPENPHIWVYVGQLYEQNGKFVEAEKAFRQVIRTEPKNGTVYALLADTFLKRGLGKQSVEPFKKALVFEPNNLRALRSLAWVLATHPDALVRDADLATRLAAKANDLSDQSNLQILITLAAAYAANEEYLEATRLAEAAILAAEKDGLLEISRTFQGYLESFSRKEPIVDSTLQSG